MSGPLLLEVMLDMRDAIAQLERAERLLGNPTPIMQAIADTLESVTETNFEANGRPGWAPLSKATLAERKKRNKGDSAMKILQDVGTLAASISSTYGQDFARIGANTEYAAIHQFGGEITKAAQSRRIRLRTDAKGNLQRQANNKNLAVFARDSHKRARESWHEVGEHTIRIPARPYLPFRGPPGAAAIQPEAEQSILAVLDKLLGGAFR